MSGSSDTLPAAELPAGRRLALVVATTRYADTSLRQLRAPARDAADLCEVLADPHIGGFAVTSVIDRPAQQVRLAVEEFLADRRPDDLLLVYLSCHGLVDLRRRLYFAATDTLKHRLAATGVEAQWLLDQLEDCRARRQVMILDCCFSGAFAQGSKGVSDLGLGERFHGQGRGRVVLTASRATEYSFEGDPLPGSAMPGSVFTGALVAGIRTGAADADNDGFISVDDAYAYAFDHIRATDAQQTPQRWLYGAEGTIVLARSPAGVRITPAPLPEVLRIGLDSPHPAIRLGAVAALGEWLAGDDPARRLAADHALREVADADVPRVAAAARALLEPGSAPSTATRGGGARDDVPRAGDSRAEPAPPAPGWGPLPARAARRATLLGTGDARRRRRLVYGAGVAALLAIAGIVAAVLIPDRSSSPPPGARSGGQFTATSPWRLKIDGTQVGSDPRCTVTVTNTETGEEKAFVNVYGARQFQVQDTGTFRWDRSHPGCRVTQHPGPGTAVLPFSQKSDLGDTDAFTAPEAPGKVAVQVLDFHSYRQCEFVLRDAADGRVLDLGTATPGGGPLRLNPSGRTRVYLADFAGCDVRISAERS